MGSGYSIGMSYPQALRRIILPQAARVSIPPLSNTFISLVKDTSLASVVLVTEMFRRAQEIAATNYEFLLVYFGSSTHLLGHLLFPIDSSTIHGKTIGPVCSLKREECYDDFH